MSERTDQRQKVKAAALRGTWRIVETDLWDVEALDLIEPAHLTFTANGLGELQLIAIGAAIDYRISDETGSRLSSSRGRATTMAMLRVAGVGHALSPVGPKGQALHPSGRRIRLYRIPRSGRGSREARAAEAAR